ncbi:MAG TPA: VWA-like domain-containing protein [Thermoanaerobaculia bacterium]|jgi:predicted metal-dependent peptidase|nr:VWA-like domain-containing protein [Thermoanaerobaculia bacterium]
MPPRQRPEQKLDPATKAFQAGHVMLHEHPLFQPLVRRVIVNRERNNYCPADGWAVTLETGVIHAHPTRRGDPEEWAYVLGHCVLHLAFGHFRIGEKSLDWNAACDVVVARFLADLKFGRCPVEMQCELHEVRTDDEDRLFRRFREHTLPDALRGIGTGGERSGDMFWAPEPMAKAYFDDWSRLFAIGLVASVTSAVRVAGGYEARLGDQKENVSVAEAARRWFINSYPLLGALAAAFTIIEDPLLCQRMGISVAAVNAEAKEIFVAPSAGLSADEAKFVIAHELLHVGLRHEARRRGRDPELWNIACDYVINGWLIEMGLGAIPTFGGLHDPQLKGLSADAIYDRLAVDMRRNRKLSTLRGIGACDMLDGHVRDWWARDDAMSLDDFYRRALAQGLSYHQEEGRGLIPAALIEEIRALDRPPIAWDVELAKWFDDHFSPIDRIRTYARASRRQSATPDIPRPRYVPAPEDANRTYAVVLDTSGSMDRTLLAKCLGTIASYSAARDVHRVRLVFCDADAYDQGYVAADDIADRVKVKGRGGTVLQPAINLLEKAEDFPEKGPILIITDGQCDRLRIRREHAFLLPQGHSLPFVPRGPVFAVK